MSNPDQLAADTRRTQDNLRADVSKLTERVNPERFVGTRREKLGQGLGAVRERVMGVASTAAESAGASAKSAAGSVQDAAHDADSSARDAGGADAVLERTQGNPVAAGLIAFGAGWLLSSLLPASSAEQSAAQQLEEHADGLVDPLKQSVADAADSLREPAREAARSVQQSASEAADRTTTHARFAADEVGGHARSAGNEVTDHAQDAGSDMTGDVAGDGDDGRRSGPNGS